MQSSDNTKQLFYKNGKKVIIRKPKDINNYIPFIASFFKTRNLGINSIKSFLKYVITDVKELNFIKNDVGFLMHELFNNISSSKTTHNEFTTSLQHPLTGGTIIYIWVYLPSKYDMTKFETPSDVRESIFPFDLFFTRLSLTKEECKMIKDILFKDVDVKVFCRKVHETPVLPCSLKSIN